MIYVGAPDAGCCTLAKVVSAVLLVLSFASGLYIDC
jgi:hypothetical protein